GLGLGIRTNGRGKAHPEGADRAAGVGRRKRAVAEAAEAIRSASVGAVIDVDSELAGPVAIAAGARGEGALEAKTQAFACRCVAVVARAGAVDRISQLLANPAHGEVFERRGRHWMRDLLALSGFLPRRGTMMRGCTVSQRRANSGRVDVSGVCRSGE